MKRSSTRRQSRFNIRSFAAFLTIALAFAVVGGTVGSFLAQTATAEEAEPLSTGYSAIYSSDNPVPEIAANVRPAVVQVINMAQTWDRSTGEVSTVEQGYGSGVYFDERGYVLTNYHVVEGADSVEILTLDNNRLKAEIVGYDDGTDIAVIKVDGKINATPVPLGDSDELQIGELAICIGNPGISDVTLFGTVTTGIISALDRETVNARNFSRSVNVIQTDAAINTGNSGGALLNAKGELIGIPTLKFMYSYSTVYEGLGFAIPINTAKPVVEDIIEHGKVLRPRMGVSVNNVEGPDEALRNYPPAGIQVMAVEEGSPAAKAGVKKYDIITEIDGLRVKTYTEMTAQIDTHSAGESVKLKIYRYYDAETGTALSKPETVELEVELQILDA